MRIVCKYEYDEKKHNLPYTKARIFEVEGESITHWQYRDDNGSLVWNNKKYFDVIEGATND